MTRLTQNAAILQSSSILSGVYGAVKLDKDAENKLLVDERGNVCKRKLEGVENEATR